MPLCASAAEFIPSGESEGESQVSNLVDLKTESKSMVSRTQDDPFEIHSLLTIIRKCDECSQRAILAVMMHKDRQKTKKCCRHCVGKFGKEFPTC